MYRDIRRNLWGGRGKRQRRRVERVWRSLIISSPSGKGVKNKGDEQPVDFVRAEFDGEKEIPRIGVAQKKRKGEKKKTEIFPWVLGGLWGA